MLCCGEMYAIWRVRIQKHSDHKLNHTTLFLALFSACCDPFILSKRTRWFHLSEIEAYPRSRLCVVLHADFNKFPWVTRSNPLTLHINVAFPIISVVIFLSPYFKGDFYGSFTCKNVLWLKLSFLCTLFIPFSSSSFEEDLSSTGTNTYWPKGRKWANSPFKSDLDFPSFNL